MNNELVSIHYENYKKRRKRLTTENLGYEDVLKIALDEGTSDIGLLCAIVDEIARREKKQLLQTNYIANIFYNAKLDEYLTEKPGEAQ